MLLPGSDFLIAGLARLLLLIAVVWMAVKGLIILVRRARRRSSDGRAGPAGSTATAGPTASPTVGNRWSRMSRSSRVLSVLTAIGVVAVVLTWPPRVEVPEFPALPDQLLPATSLFYRPIEDLPVRPESDAWIRALGSLPFGGTLGGAPYLGNVAGMPFNVVDASSPLIDVDIVLYPDSSFLGPFPSSDPMWIEGFFNYGQDQHYLTIDPKQRRAWELIQLRRWLWRWEADAGATWSMDSNDYPTGATIVAGLPLLPGMVRYDEVESGSVDHMILAGSSISAKGQHIWPARGTDGVSLDPAAPPMGAWMRLRSDADLSGLGPQATIIARAAQRYGVMISDTGPGFGIRGTADRRWDTADLRTLEKLTTDDFEFVDASRIKIADDTLEVLQPGDTGAGG